MRREIFAICASGTQVGAATAVFDGSRLQIDSGVSNNGRGARLAERLAFDGVGLPVEWQITGTSLMGGTVDETFSDTRSAQSGRFWRSQADSGTDADTGPALYLAADPGPLAPWIYARAALAAGGEIAALPSGRVRAGRLSRVRLGVGLDAVELDFVMVTGTALTPQWVLVDPDLRLVACTGGNLGLFREIAIREDRIPVLQDLESLMRSTEEATLAEIARRVCHEYATTIRFSNVRVFNPHAGKLSPPASVTVYDGTIAAIEPEPARARFVDEVTIDGGGGTLLPGLHDMHAHIGGWSGLYYLAAGVTTVRDMGNVDDELKALRQRFAAGTAAGPRVIPSGFLEGRSGYSMQLGVIPDSLGEALEVVRRYAAEGYHQIKIYNSVDPDWVAPLAAEAHRLGLRVAGHVPAFSTPDRVIEDGYDEITHVNQLMLGWLLGPGEDTRTPLRLTAMARAAGLDLDSAAVMHTVARMAADGIGLDTTAVILERLMLSRAQTVTAGDAAYLSHLPVSYQRQRKRTYVPYCDGAELDAYEASFARVLELIGLLHRQGVPLWPGTDDGTGFTLHRELELYVAAGLPAIEVLQIATLGCARHLGLGHSHGSVERGKAASLILLDGDPTSDISAVRRVSAVMNEGRLSFPAEIYRELSVAPFTAPPPVSVPGSARSGLR